MKVLLALLCCAFFSACGLLQNSDSNTANKNLLAKIEQKPLQAHEADELNTRVTDSFFYGDGLGDSAVKVGAAVAFPPFILVMLGNAALSVSGYEPIGVSTILPEDASKQWQEAYSGVVSVPGKLAANAADKDYVNKSTMTVVNEYLTEREYMAEVF